MTPTTIKALFALALKAELERTCIDEVSEDDPSGVSRVVIGRFTGSITRENIILEIHTKHPLGPEREERRNTQGTEQSDAQVWKLPTETIGGTKFRWERGTVQVRYHLRLEREEAVPIIEAVTTRVRITIDDSPLLIGLLDDFGCTVHTVEVTDDYSYTNEAGNPTTERAFIDWRLLVSRKRTRA